MKDNKLVNGFIIVIKRILLMIIKNGVINIIATCFGIYFIVAGILEIVKNKRTVEGVIMIVIGAAVIIFGWLLVSIVLYVVAALLVVYGIYTLYQCFNAKIKFKNLLSTILFYLIPILYIIAGICLFFNQGEIMNVAFIVSGAVLLVNGIIMIVESLRN